MTKRRKLLITLSAVVLALGLIVGVTAIAVNNYGTSSDPLISMSYLKNTLLPQLSSQFQELVDDSAEDLTQYIDSRIAASGGGGGESYKVVTLSRGQQIIGQVGCEFILRIGTASCTAADSPGLVNASSGGTIESGDALEKNNVYIVSIADNGITATAGTVKVLVRGSYTIS